MALWLRCNIVQFSLAIYLKIHFQLKPFMFNAKRVFTDVSIDLMFGICVKIERENSEKIEENSLASFPHSSTNTPKCGEEIAFHHMKVLLTSTIEQKAAKENTKREEGNFPVVNYRWTWANSRQMKKKSSLNYAEKSFIVFYLLPE